MGSIQAFYEPSPVLEYAGNPLIEALPPISGEEEAAEAIASIPPLPGEERALPKHIRLHCLNRISYLVQPFMIHLEVEAVIGSVIRSGYIGRNPMDADTWRHMHSIGAKGGSSITNSTASTFSLIGLSGMGKTTALKAVLKLYPQVITHAGYDSIARMMDLWSGCVRLSFVLLIPHLVTIFMQRTILSNEA